jgi:PPK2 family polyphosphate:nucleotide phosphotransferase
MSRKSHRLEAAPSDYLAPFDGSFRVSDLPTEPPDDAPGKSGLKERLEELNGELSELQEVLYASDSYAVLCIFQALDAAGKDGTIKAVLQGVNPAGCEVYSFKQPSHEELDHDFLWRTTQRLPQRGRIGVFNRSYYEEVLAVRVHPEYLAAQRLPEVPAEQLWQERFESIRNHELHLANNGIVILKFWLNVSKEEQRKRFLARLDEPDKNWKFAVGDVKEREHWDDYMHAFEEAISETSRAWARWYAIPADNKRYMRVCVAEIIVSTLKQLKLAYPKPNKEVFKRVEEMKALLAAGD